MSEPEEVWIDGKKWQKHGDALSRPIEPDDIPELIDKQERYFVEWQARIRDEWQSEQIQDLAKQTVKLIPPKFGSLAIELAGLDSEEPQTVESVSKSYNMSQELVQALHDYFFDLMIKVNRSNPLKKYSDEDSDDEHGYDFEPEGFDKLHKLLEQDPKDFSMHFDGLVSKIFKNDNTFWHVNWSNFPELLYELDDELVPNVDEYLTADMLIEELLNGILGWSETLLAMLKFGFSNYRGSLGDELVGTSDDGTELVFVAGYPYMVPIDHENWLLLREFGIEAVASFTGINHIRLREMYMLANPDESNWLFFVQPDFRDLITLEMLIDWAKGNQPLDEDTTEVFYNAIMARRYSRSWGLETEARLGIPNILTYISHLIFDISGVQPFGDKYQQDI
jgi:hypothetical protein